MAKLTDDRVRAELERIGDGVLSLLFVKYRRYQTEHHLIGEDDDNLVVALRLLAESQRALGEIATSEASMYYSKAMAQPCRICMGLINIARNARKGGE